MEKSSINEGKCAANHVGMGYSGEYSRFVR
jgi:hypothetical protein